MTLHQICTEIAEVEEGLAYGEISFNYDRLYCAMKPGHPADLLDDILSMIGWTVFEGKTPDFEKVKEVRDCLKAFKDDFKIKELSKPIKHIEEYIKTEEAKNKTEKTIADESTTTKREAKTLEDYLCLFDVVENKTRRSYSYLGNHMFCIKRDVKYVVGVPHRTEFAEYAKKCHAAHVGYSGGVFGGWVRFENENDMKNFLEYVVDIRTRE